MALGQRSETRAGKHWHLVLKLGQEHFERAQERAKGNSTGTPVFQGWVQGETGRSCEERTRIEWGPDAEMSYSRRRLLQGQILQRTSVRSRIECTHCVWNVKPSLHPQINRKFVRNSNPESLRITSVAGGCSCGGPEQDHGLTPLPGPQTDGTLPTPG